MVRIAVTGGIGCGKSFVASCLSEQGAEICETDELTRFLMRRGGDLYDPVLEEFGKGILSGSGEIDRGKLGAEVFGDVRKLEALNAITHPVIRKSWEAWLADQESHSPPGRKTAAVVVAPLLFEAGYESGWDAVVCVTACIKERQERLIGRGLSESGIRARIASQGSLAEKAFRSDFVVVNNGTRESAKEQSRRILRRILEN